MSGGRKLAILVGANLVSWLILTVAVFGVRALAIHIAAAIGAA